MSTTAVCRALIVWAVWASAALSQAPPPTVPPAPAARDAVPSLPLYTTRQHVFAIPFTADRRIAQPVEVHLYVSTDRGATWQLSARQAPGARQFTFRSRGDGEYWFASRTLAASQPASTQKGLRPELRVVVDTTPPQLELALKTSPHGEVLADWQAADANLLANSGKIEYQEDASQPWKPVSTQAPASDAPRTSYQSQATWRPETRSPTINVRAEVRDRAGNLAVVNRRLLLPLPAQGALANAMPAFRVADPFARLGQPSEGAMAWPSDNIVTPQSALAGAPPAGNLPPHEATAAPEAGPHLPGQLASSRAPDSTADAAAPLPTPLEAPPTTGASTDGAPAAPPASGAAGPTLPAPPPTDQPAPAPATPDLTMLAPATPAGEATTVPGAAAVPPGERPQMTRATRFQLSYDVHAVGPSGVAEVQLWATGDSGQTWRLWGTDDDLQSPFDVVVDQEGIFGFHVVVVGRNGLAGRKPRTGDLADIYVGVDTQSPTARLTAAAYGEGAQAGKLLIRWEASDAYLDPRPITLKFAEDPAGPWTVIASALANTGEFAWPADAHIPAAVYLQLEVRDEAGNTATDQTADPVRMDGLAPKARIRGIQPIHEVDREAFRRPRRG